MATCGIQNGNDLSGPICSKLTATVSLCVLLCAVFPAPSHAQAFTGSLMDAVQITIANEPTIASGKQRVVASTAAVLSAASVFDTTLNAGVGVGSQNTSTLAAQQSALGPSVVTRSNDYSVGATRKFRSGVTLNPALTVTRTEDTVSNPTGPMRSDAVLNVVFPLLRGSGTAVNTAPERSAQFELEAEQLAYRHAIATSIQRTTLSYWDYAAALQSLAVRRESVQQSQTLLDNARRLAKADEIPAADVIKYEARLSRDRSGVINQEQVLNQASTDLLQAMGLRKTTAELPLPSDRFPDIPPEAVQLLLSPAAADNLQWTAKRQRADVLALQKRQQSAQTLLDAAENNHQAQLDLKVGIGYAGLVENRAATSALSSVGNGVGPNLSISLNYAFPVSNLAKRAELTQRIAALELVNIDYESSLNTLQRNLSLQLGRLGELVVLHDLEQEQAVLQQRVSDNERRRYSAGLITAFELISAEDQLTQERLDGVTAAKRLAQAIVNFRFEAGLLLDAKADIQTLPLAKLTSLPTLNELQAP